MIERRPRGRPFEAGNRGRPPGSKNKVTQLVEQLAEGEAEQLVQKVIELARAGDVACLRMVFDRLWPVRKGRPVSFELPSMDSLHDVLSAHVSIWKAIADGLLTPDETGALSLIRRRLKALETRRAEKQKG